MRKIVLVLALTAAVGATGAVSMAATGGSGAKAAPLAQSLAAARLATAKYSTNLNRAKADGYGVITQMIPDMGWHFMNPKVSGFDVTKPAILVYVKHGTTWELGALEWVFTAKPKTPPLPGAKYGGFGAACHYKDGTFTPEAAQADCPAKSP